ncbi:DUF1404 domain-containing protein [Acidianus brierleyi]|uniref:DUF1404 domain-containing protein n=1 Tax=Acidianus brierleyi TaxID=41673 RepID=A0A2U9IB64_9CREN|nr:DUF1404 domain-containing protein [Acidianus brierleyi]AWR93267.1 DUF1404 domain-containing protein [Acidianus brierleyi]
MIRYIPSSFSWKSIILPIVFVVAFVNPYVEILQFNNPVIFMLDHYALYAAGVLIGYKMFKGSIYSFILGIIPAVFWHVPYFFALAAAYIDFRALCEITLFLGGLLAGSFIYKMSLTLRIISLAVYMLGDTLLSIFFILAYPQYSNATYRFLSWSPGALPAVGIAMLIVMNLILVYSIIKIMKSAMIF